MDELNNGNNWIIDRIGSNINNNMNNTIIHYEIMNNNIHYEIMNENYVPDDEPNNIINAIEQLFIPFGEQQEPEQAPTPTYITIDICSVVSDNDDIECCVCMEQQKCTKFCKLNCEHLFCVQCTITHVRQHYVPVCPLCLADVTAIYVSHELAEEFANELHPV